MSERMIEECAKALCEDAGWKWGEQSFLRDRYRRRARVVFSHLDALGYAVVPREPVTQAFDPATAAAPCQIDGCRYSARDEEIARLKEALEDIASGKYSGVILTSFPPQDAAVNRARAALEGK